MYLIHNGNLLYHGCIPMESDGSFTYNEVDGQQLGPREYMDYVERIARQGYFSADPTHRQAGQDMMWALWSSPKSPLYGKDRMATFERYFLDDGETHRETKNPYYDYRDQEQTAARILAAFGLEADRGHIINGHVPVRVGRGESPVKANGRLLVIDGGFSKAYQERTGIAGYTLVFSSHGMILCAHEPFASKQSAIEQGVDIHSQTEILETSVEPILVRDTDDGMEMRQRISALQRLLQAYRAGLIKERQ
jgi:fructose-1,6-bisphosphatase-3